MVFPSCQPPSTFAAFGQYRQALQLSGAKAQGGELARPNDSNNATEAPVTDTFLDPSQSVTPRRAAGLFALGLGTSLAGRKGLMALLKKTRMIPETGPVRMRTDSFNGLQGKEFVDEMNLSQSYEGLASVFILGQRGPHLVKALISYLAVSVLGYTAGSAAQGAQEAWVRREETKIRAQLINSLTTAFRQSIRTKNENDRKLKEEARARAYELLERNGVPDAAELLVPEPVSGGAPGSPSPNQRYYNDPLRLGMPVFRGENPTMQALPPANPADEKQKRTWLQVAIFGAGALTGASLQAFMRMFSLGQPEIGKPAKMALNFPGKIINYETTRLNAVEAMVIHACAGRQNLFVASGFFALTALAKLGQLFVDGLREIEVTRANARTERSYQFHNWLTQDPTFRDIAESEALNESLRQLQADLPGLMVERSALRARIQALLAEVGKNSVSKYFPVPMAPQVGLAPARG